MHLVQAHGARIPAIGLGTWPMRGQSCVRAVVAALQAGYRHIDTAASYGNEAEVGEAIAAAGVPAGEIFVTTKVWPTDIAEGDLQHSVEASLARLGLDAVDLALIHWPSRNVPVAESIAALNDVRTRGLARHIGVSNFNVDLLEAAWAASEAPLAALQCEYHPRLDQSKLLAAARARGMAFTAYAPLGRGRVLDERPVVEIARAHGRTPSQVVLRWLIQQPGVVAVPKSATPARIAENLDVFGFALSEAEMAAISALARPGGRIVDVAGHAPAWDD